MTTNEKRIAETKRCISYYELTSAYLRAVAKDIEDDKIQNYYDINVCCEEDDEIRVALYTAVGALVKAAKACEKKLENEKHNLAELQARLTTGICDKHGQTIHVGDTVKGYIFKPNFREVYTGDVIKRGDNFCLKGILPIQCFRLSAFTELELVTHEQTVSHREQTVSHREQKSAMKKDRCVYNPHSPRSLDEKRAMRDWLSNPVNGYNWNNW